jgi:uncharacterized iron-regulated membrane protein
LKAGKRIFLWHHWCGLVAGIFLLIMSISGAILAFTDEIESSYESSWIKVDNPGGTFTYDSSFTWVQKTNPGWEIRLYGSPGINEALVYDLRKGNEIKKLFLHPTSGELIHIDNEVHKQLHRQLLTLHYTLFASTPGKIIVFIVGILFLLTIITGIYIYRKALVRVLLFRVRISRKTKRSFYSSLHRVVGVWSLLFNLLIVITGLFISWGIIKAAIKQTPAPEKISQKVIYSIDKIKSGILEQHPDFNIHLIRVAAGSNTVQLSGNFNDDPFYYGKYYSRFYVDGEKGNIQKTEWLREQKPFKKWQSIVGPLHFGNYGGLPVKILYCFFGLMPGILSISGFLLWMRRNKNFRMKARQEIQ